LRGSRLEVSITRLLMFGFHTYTIAEIQVHAMKGAVLEIPGGNQDQSHAVALV
jgi:hypothetical protein